MSDFRFFVDIEARYSDLDPQGHVNNTRFFTYIEHARLEYLLKLGLWDGVSFLNLGIIVADAHMAYLAPIRLGQLVRVGARVARIGTKSLSFEYELTDARTGQCFARGDTVMVAYDYTNECSIPVPASWREKIEAFEKSAALI